MLLVNNTGCALTVTAQNTVVYKNVQPGQTVCIQPADYSDKTAVAVTGWKDEQYIGADDWIFYNGQAQVWRVDHLNPPR